MNAPFRDLLASGFPDERQVYYRPYILYSQVVLYNAIQYQKTLQVKILPEFFSPDLGNHFRFLVSGALFPQSFGLTVPYP